MRRILCTGGVLAALAVAALWSGMPGAQAAQPAQAGIGADQQLYQRLCTEYLDGSWDELSADIDARTAQIALLIGTEAEDVKYIQKALLECRQPWWNQSKAGKKIPLRPFLWGRVLNLTFDPDGQNSLQMKSENGATSLTVTWKTDDMDSTDEAEHGFTKGELCNLGTWGTLGMADCWARIPLATLANMKPADKTIFMQYIDFRSALTGDYYGMPRARRWGFFLSLLYYLDKYEKQQNLMSRRALGAAFVAEIVSHADKYPSIHLPDACPDDNQEEKLALQLKDWIETHGWTVAEDRSLRAMLKTFAANDQQILKTGQVTLINGLNVAMDPDKDKALRPKRDAWLKEQFGKAKRPG